MATGQQIYTKRFLTIAQLNGSTATATCPPGRAWILRHADATSRSQAAGDAFYMMAPLGSIIFAAKVSAAAWMPNYHWDGYDRLDAGEQIYVATIGSWDFVVVGYDFVAP